MYRDKLVRLDIELGVLWRRERERERERKRERVLTGVARGHSLPKAAMNSVRTSRPLCVPRMTAGDLRS